MRAALQMVLGLALAAPALAVPAGADLIFPDRQRRAVVDDAHVLSDAQNRALSARILAYVQATHHQLVVATVPTLQGHDVKDFGYRLLRAWGLGDSRRNDGVILLLSTHPREVRIEVGYGLEPVLTDAATGIILRTDVVPRLKAGDVAGGLAAGANAIMAATGGAGIAAGPPPQPAVQGQVPLIGNDGTIRKLTAEEAQVLRVVGIVFAAALLLIGLLFLLFLFLARRGGAAADGYRGDGGGSPTSYGSGAGSSSTSDSGFDSGGGSAGGGGADSSW